MDVPRERVFDYLADIANHVEFTDHFVEEFRLERIDSRGVGAAARFRIASGLARLPFLSPLASLWVEVVLTELEPPHRLVIEGRAGRNGRVPIRGECRLTPHDHGMARVEYTFSSDPANRIDRLREALGARSWLRRQYARSLRRLRSILEDGEPSLRAARVAAG
jgi:uncharacterized protein YndB with AHSA1/START domain